MSVPALGTLLFFASAPIGAGAPPATAAILATPTLPTSVPDHRQPVLPEPVPLVAPPPQSFAVAEASMPASVEPKVQTNADDHGEIVVTSRARHVPGDPLQELNFATFQVTQAVDEAVVRPAAMAYSRIVPEPVRLGIRNFLDHLYQPVVFVNFLLQHKVGKAVETFGRFVINTTIGIVGVFDIAKRKPFKLPNRKNGFADTMGFYGVKSGPFLFLPIVGPTTARDLVGLFLDRLLVPLAAGRPFNKPAFAIPAGVLGQLDQRDQFDEELEARKGDARGFYSATREEYLKDRRDRIDALHGKRTGISVPVAPSTKPDAK